MHHVAGDGGNQGALYCLHLIANCFLIAAFLSAASRTMMPLGMSGIMMQLARFKPSRRNAGIISIVTGHCHLVDHALHVFIVIDNGSSYNC
jgi:hypothetical protein